MAVQGDSLGVATITLAADPVPLETTMASAHKRVEASLASMEAMSGKRLATVGQNMSRLGSQWTRTVSLPIVGGGAAMIKVASDFEGALTQVQTQAGASAREIENMRGAILKLAPAVGQTPVALANALYHVESAGLRGAKALDVLTQSAKLAQIGHSDLEQTTSALVAVMKSAPKDVKNATDAIGLMNAVVGAGNMRMGDLVGALSTGIIPAAKSAGLGFRDIGAALDVMTSRGVPAQAGATRLAMTIALMAAPTSKAAAALKSVGIGSDQLANDMRKPDGLVVAVTDLKKHMDAAGLSATQQNALIAHAFGGGRSSRAILALVQNTGDLQKAFDGIGKHSGAKQVNEEWKKTQEDLGVRMDKLKAKAEVAFVDIGTKIAPEFLKVGTQVADDAAKIANAFSSLPKGAQDLIITGGLTAAALGPVMRLAGVLTTFVGRTWDALKIAQELATGKRTLLGGLTSKASGKVGSAVATMEVGEMIVKTMIGGAGGGLPGRGGGAAGTVAKDAEKVGGGAGGAAGLRAAIGADVSVGEVAPYLAPLLLAGLFGTNYKDAAKAAIGNLSQTVKGVLSSAELKNLGASAGVGSGQGRLGAFPWTPDTLKLIKQADIALAQFASTGNARGLDRVKVSAAALAKQWPTNASEMRSLIKVMNAAERGALPGIAAASRNAGDTITTKFADKMSAARDVVKNSTGDARKYAIQNFTRLQHQASSAFDGLERKVASSQSKMTASIRSGSKNLADVAWKNFGSFQASVKNAMTAGVLDASKGAQLIAEALNSTLKALGAGTIPVPALVHAADLAGMKGVGPSALLNPGGGAAQGALVQFGRRGDAGVDQIPVNMGGQGIMVGSGEVGAVFTRHQFAAANQMLAGIGGLPGLFQRVDRPHYMASGGFVSTAYGPPWGGIEGGGVTATGVDLRRGQKAYIIATDPSVIPMHSNVKVTPNPFGYTGTFRAEDTGGAIKGNRIDFYDWLGRASQNAWGRRDVTAEIVGHAFGGKVGAAIAGAVAQAIKAPGVSGHGAIATMVRAALGKAAKAANRYEAAHMPTPAVAGGPGAGSASTFAGKGDYRMYRWPVPAGAPFTPGRVDRGQDFETSPHGVFDAIGDMIITSGATDFPGITGRLLAGPARGMQAFHGHTFESFVRAGQHVSAGQPLGRVGHQGQSYDGGVTHLELGFLTSAGQVAPPENAAHYSYTGQEMHDLLEHIRPFSRGGFVNAARGYLGNKPAGLTFGHPNYPKVLPLSTASPAILGLLGNLNSILDPNTGDVAKLQDRDTSLQNIFGLTPFGNINTAGDAIVTPADGSMPYIDQGLVGGRVKQLTQLFGLEVGARNELQFALKLIAPLLIRLRNAIEARRKRIERIKAKIRANLRKIKGLLDLIKAERHRKLPGDHKARAAARKESAKRITGWDSQIRGIKDENAQLGGNRDSIGSGGELGALSGQISTLQTDLGNVIGDQQGIVGPSGIGGSLGAAKITVAQRQQDLAALSAPAQGLALAAAVSSATGSGAAGTTSALDALDQQKIDELSQRLAVSQDQYRVLSQLPAFGGSFAAGGIVPGMLGEPRTIIAHGGEMVTPAGDGMLHEHNVIFGPKTRWLEDFVDVRVEHKTRSISRAAKPLAGARAGQLGRR